MNTTAREGDNEMTRLFKACAVDSDGAMYVVLKWRCTEGEARRFFDRFATGATHLVGNGGLLMVTR